MRKLFFLPLFFTVLQLVAGCTKQKNAADSSMPIDNSQYKSYLALGDSYTIGESVAAADRFPAQATAMLANDTMRFLAPEYIATTGWTTRNLLNAISSNPPTKATYDFVTLLIGVNNQYQGRSQAEYSAEFTNLLNLAIRYAGNRVSRVAVLSIPDWSATPFASGADTALIRKQIDSFNIINKQITLANSVQYIDITLSTRIALTDPSLVAGDGLHPSAKEYKKWAILLAAYMKTVL